jgi:hypothetical protein
MIKTATQIRVGDIVTLLDNAKRPTPRTIREVTLQNGNVALRHSGGTNVLTPNSTLEVAEPIYA